MLEDTQGGFDVKVLGIMNIWAFMPLIREGKQKKVIAISSTMGNMGESSYYPILSHKKAPISHLAFLQHCETVADR